MLRERVLRSWKDCKEKVLDGKKRQLSPKLVEIFSITVGMLHNITSNLRYNTSITSQNTSKLWSTLNKYREEEHEMKIAYSKINFTDDDSEAKGNVDLVTLVYYNTVDALSQFIKALEDKK